MHTRLSPVSSPLHAFPRSHLFPTVSYSFLRVRWSGGQAVSFFS